MVRLGGRVTRARGVGEARQASTRTAARRMRRCGRAGAALLCGAGRGDAAAAQVVRRCRPTSAAAVDAERSGTHDAANIRTVFWNYGMVGDYPPDPGNVDLSVFHSVEVPKGSGMNYSDGITPFVLAKIRPARRHRHLHHGDRIPRAAGDQPEPQPGHALRAAPRLLPARPGDQRRPLPGDQQRPAHLARLLAGPLARPGRSGLGREAGTATSASGRPPTRKATRSWTTTTTTPGTSSPTAATPRGTAWACASRCAASSGRTRRPAT